MDHRGILGILVAQSDTKWAYKVEFSLGAPLKIGQFEFDLVNCRSQQIYRFDAQAVSRFGVDEVGQCSDVQAVGGDPAVVNAQQHVTLLLSDHRLQCFGLGPLEEVCELLALRGILCAEDAEVIDQTPIWPIMLPQDRRPNLSDLSI